MNTKKLCLPVLLLALMGNAGCPRASDFMRLYGYTEIRPPSKILTPGTMVLITNKSPFEARVICDVEDSVGDVTLTRSQTASGLLKQMQGKQSSLDASVMGLVKENSAYKHVQNIDVTLDNVSILEITDANILEALGARSQSCEHAVRQRLKQGYTITMISSALVADVKYTIHWATEATQELSVDDKMGLMHDLSLTLGGKAEQVTDASIYAKGLIWGVRDDEFLAALSQPDVDESEIPRGTRQIDVEKVVLVAP